MIINYFVLAFRNLKKQRSYAVINTLGLAIGLASAFFIFLYVRHELTYDNYHPHAADTYRLGYRIDFPNGDKDASPYAPAGWDNYIKDNYPGISQISSFVNPGMPASVEYEPTNTILLTEEIIWAEGNLTDILHIDIVKGTSEHPGIR
jgi:putative ABC transport system permease protein